ncbi:MAG: bacteriocin [Clostridia bacterium]|nr:bacteriocin [Clostridia bacterium]MBR0388417.1 bacteriocin [Clostridia bacterium]
MNTKEMNMKELEQVNGGNDNGIISGKPNYPFPQPVGLPMPRPKPNNIVVPFPDN